MLLTKTEQEKTQSYVIKNMIEEQQRIRELFEDKEYEQAFIEYMINKDYANAFELCTRVFNVHANIDFMIELLNLFFPNVRRNWAKYYIFVHPSNPDDINKYVTYECKCAEELPQIIFD